MTTRPAMDDGPNRPDYPPRTPPPPKRPVEAPRPDTSGGQAAVVVQPRLRARIANRRAANWPLDTAPWARSSVAPKAGRNVVQKLEAWGYRLPADSPVHAVTARLVTAALEDGGSRISVHLADQDQQALILVLTHQPGHATGDEQLLHDLAAYPVVSSCGTDTDRDHGGRRHWALIDL